jgi:predicted O-methyltransferase YrrM
MTTFADAFAEVQDIAGWLTEAQARLLFARAAALGVGGRVVEIGTYHGRSTIILARAAPGSELITIDPYASEPDVGPRDLAIFQEHLALAKLSTRVRHLRKSSRQALAAVDGPVDLLYIDGAHDFVTAFADIRDWGDRVRDGGTMLIHDSFSSIGVTTSEVLALFFGRRFCYVGRSRSLAEYRREPVFGVRRVTNAARQAASLPWFARNVLVKVGLTLQAPVVARALGHRDDVFPY